MKLLSSRPERRVALSNEQYFRDPFVPLNARTPLHVEDTTYMILADSIRTALVDRRSYHVRTASVAMFAAASAMAQVCCYHNALSASSSKCIATPPIRSKPWHTRTYRNTCCIWQAVPGLVHYLTHAHAQCCLSAAQLSAHTDENMI